MGLLRSGLQTAMVPIATLGGADATLRPFGAPRKRTAVHSEDDGGLAVLTHVWASHNRDLLESLDYTVKL